MAQFTPDPRLLPGERQLIRVLILFQCSSTGEPVDDRDAPSKPLCEMHGRYRIRSSFEDQLQDGRFDNFDKDLHGIF
jgi:hypothetical protein